MNFDSQYHKYTVEELVDNKDFRRWVTHPDEKLDSYWNSFIGNNPEEASEVKEAAQIIRALYFEEETASDTHYQQSLAELKNYQNSKSKSREQLHRIFTLVRNAAAILMVPVLLFSIYQSRQSNESLSILNESSDQTIKYIVPTGQKSSVVLADGTKVWLNSGTTLTVPMSESRKRNVYLEGEAFFDVVKNKKVPFVVETKDYSVKVFGTQFDVRSYNNKAESETILKEGSISIMTKGNEEIKMTPGQAFFVNKEKKHLIAEVNPEIYISWKDNVLKIDNEELHDLLIRMEHWYGVKIHVDNYEMVKNLKYTLTIKTESLREMLDLMCYVTPLTYKVNGDQVTLKYKLKQ